MDREVSIVLSVERRNYRKLAQDWYGLTDEQMVDMDVHHNPARHEGGRNIAEHLYVYHNTLHSAVHENKFVLWSRKGGENSHKEKRKDGKSKRAVELGAKTNAKKNAEGKSINAVTGAIKSHENKDENGKSVQGVKNGKKGAKTQHSQRWMSTDPNFPPYISTPTGLSSWQKARGIDVRNRVRVG